MVNARKPLKFKFEDIARRITGIQVLVFGVSWNPPPPERAAIRDLLIFLEDRRALYNPEFLEMESQVAESVLEIRDELTRTIRKIGEESKAVPALRALRSACRKYLDSAHSDRLYRYGHNFFVYLGELRAEFGTQVAYLSVQYGIDIEQALASILPAHLTEDNCDVGSNRTEGGGGLGT